MLPLAVRQEQDRVYRTIYERLVPLIKKIREESTIPLILLWEVDEDGLFRWNQAAIAVESGGGCVVPVGEYWMDHALADKLDKIGWWGMARLGAIASYIEEFSANPGVEDNLKPEHCQADGK
jgi:hypothetical protein